jgi:hypothetical protein
MQDCVPKPIQVGFAIIKALFHGLAFNQVRHVGDYPTAFTFSVSLDRFNNQFFSHG